VRLGSGSATYGSESADSYGEARFNNIEAGVYDYSVSSSAGNASGKISISSSGNRTISLSGSGSSSSNYVGEVEVRVSNNSQYELNAININVVLEPIYPTGGSTISRSFRASETVRIPTYMGEYRIADIYSNYGSLVADPGYSINVPDGVAILNIRVNN
jgi:hypothetical protein